MIYFDNNKQAFAFEIPNYICAIEDNIWNNYAGTDKWDIVDGQFTDITDTEEYKSEKLKEAKLRKTKEANMKAEEYIKSGKAIYELDNGKHIEATDENIAKIGLKSVSLLIAQDFDSTFLYNTVEYEPIEINALQGKEIAEKLGEVQDKVWNVKFQKYISDIENANTIDEVNKIVINYGEE